MIKHIIIGLSFSIIMQVHAMEIQPTIDNEKICYLAFLSLDIQKLIADFLTCDDETEKEFIERTSIKKEIPGAEYDQFFWTKKSVFGEQQTLPLSYETLRVFSFDKTKIALLRLPLAERYHRPILTIIDREKNETTLIDNTLNIGNYKHIALSRKAGMIAVVECRKTDPVDRFDTTFLIIKNLITQKKRTLHTFPRIWSFASIDFNKQGTHIIVHHPKTYFSPTSLFSLKLEKNEIGVPMNIDLTNTTPLQNYLIERRICKSLECSKL